VAYSSIHPFGHNRHWPKIGWVMFHFFSVGELRLHQTQSRLGRGHTKWHLSPSSGLATTVIGRKWGLFPFSEGGAVSPSKTMSPRLRPTSAPSGILTSNGLATMDIGRKLWRGLRLLFGRGAGFPSNTKLLGTRPTSIPNGIIIHAAICLQQTGRKLGGSAPFLERGSWVPI